MPGLRKGRGNGEMGSGHCPKDYTQRGIGWERLRHRRQEPLPGSCASKGRPRLGESKSKGGMKDLR
jgi:hypothetical protein